MWSPKLGLYAFLLEAVAWATLLLRSGDESALLVYLLAHAGASALVAVIAAALTPRRLQQPRWPLMLLVFGASYALPVIGLLASIGGVLMLRYLPAYRPAETFEPLALPEIDPQQRIGAGFRQSGLSSFLNNRAAPESARLRALVALQSVPGRVATPLLRGVLADSSEDLRLLAYGMLDSQEKRLNSEIHLAHQALAAAAEGSPEWLVHARRVADHYWELVYQDLVQGDLLQHALAASLRYTEAVLACSADDPAMHLRRGHLLHSLGRDDEAATAYQQALQLGLPLTRITPYLAELCFVRGDFAGVRRHMDTLDHWRALPRLMPVIDFWRPAPPAPTEPT